MSCKPTKEILSQLKVGDTVIVYRSEEEDDGILYSEEELTTQNKGQYMVVAAVEGFTETTIIIDDEWGDFSKETGRCTDPGKLYIIPYL